MIWLKNVARAIYCLCPILAIANFAFFIRSIRSITYSTPQVTLLENEDRVHVGLDATLEIRLDGEPKHLSGTALITTGLRYDSDKHEFFLDDAEFSKLAIAGLPEKLTTQVSHFASKAAKEYIEKRPIYRIRDKDYKTKAAKMLLKGFEIKRPSHIRNVGHLAKSDSACGLSVTSCFDPWDAVVAT
jgi:hypothetical protein